jgi:hypothetical protein
MAAATPHAASPHLTYGGITCDGDPGPVVYCALSGFANRGYGVTIGRKYVEVQRLKTGKVVYRHANR